MKNNYPTYWLVVIILLLILAGNVFGQDPNNADLNRDGKINLIDFALFINAYQAGNGPLPQVQPNEISLLRMELSLRDKEIAMLNAEIIKRDTDVTELKQWLWQAEVKTREMMLSIGNELLQSGVGYTINVNGRNANFKVTFDPNGVR